MMAAMGQQECGQCGYNCEDYANAIAAQAEERLNLCVPGAKETARMLKTLVEEMGGGATDPDEAKAKADAKAAAKTLDADTRPGRSRNAPVEAVFVARKGSIARVGRGDLSRRVRYFERQSIMSRATVSASFRERRGPRQAVIAAIGAPRDFPSPASHCTVFRETFRSGSRRICCSNISYQRRPRPGQGKPWQREDGRRRSDARCAGSHRRSSQLGPIGRFVGLAHSRSFPSPLRTGRDRGASRLPSTMCAMR
jgi:hypothetical protein